MILVLLLNIYVINILFPVTFLKKIADLKSMFKFEVNFWFFLEVVKFFCLFLICLLKIFIIFQLSFIQFSLPLYYPTLLPSSPFFPPSLSPLPICFSLIFLYLRNCSFLLGFLQIPVVSKCRYHKSWFWFFKNKYISSISMIWGAKLT